MAFDAVTGFPIQWLIMAIEYDCSRLSGSSGLSNVSRAAPHHKISPSRSSMSFTHSLTAGALVSAIGVPGSNGRSGGHTSNGRIGGHTSNRHIS